MQMENAPLTLPFVSNIYGDLYLDDLMSSRITNLNYADLWQSRYGELDFTDQDLYIFVGTDSGLLIKELDLNFDDSSIATIFIEDSRYIDSIRQQYHEVLDRLELVQLITIDDLDLKTKHGEFDPALLAGRVNAIRAACAEDDKPEIYREIDERINFLMDSRHWLVVNTAVRLPFVQQQLRNIPEMTYSAGHLKDRLKGQTVVLLAAGPSLDDHISWVKENRENVIVICVSRISRRLCEVGIQPDFIAVLDPHPISFEVSREAFNFDPPPILAFSSQGVNLLVGQWMGPKMYFGSRLPWKQEKFELPTSAATVSNLAFYLACYLNPKNIILIGLDFCLNEAGHTHAKGNMERDSGISLRTDMEEVKTYDGSVRLSSNDYCNSGKQLEIQIGELAEDIRVINPSGGAMYLEGVDFIPLSSIEFDVKPANAVLDIIRSEILQKNNDTSWSIEANKLFWNFKKKLSEFRALVLKAQTITREIDSQKNVSEKQFRKLDQIDNKIRKQYKPQRDLCTRSCGLFFADILDTGANQDRDITNEALEKGGQIYEAYLKSLDALQEHVDATQKSLLLSQHHHDDTWPEELVKHYLDVGLAAKIINTDKHLPDGALQRAKDLQLSQFEIRTERLEQVLGTMEISEFSLFQTLNGAYVQRSIDKLMHYKNAISKMKEFEHHTIYTALAEAYLAEVLGDNETAMQSYQKIIDEGETSLMEESLNRVAYLCIRTGDADTALMALTVLADINPMYGATLEQFRKVA